MRPPVSATPPVSHVISRKFVPTPGLTCREDWRNLTSNTSIQIMSLETSECHEQDSLFHPADISNQLTYVDTIISPRQDDISSWSHTANNPDVGNECVAETLVSLDSLTHCYGNTFDARIIFTPKERCTGRQVRRLETRHVTAERTQGSSHCTQRLNRNFYSDSDLDGDYKNTHATLKRSKSLCYAEYTRRKTETGFVEPLRPCVHKSKIGGVKRIPSFRDTSKRVSLTGTQIARDTVRHALVNNRDNFNTHIVTNKPGASSNSEDRKRVHHSEGTYKIEAQTSKIAKLMKNGLKSVIKSNSNYNVKCTASSQGVANSTALERRRYRKARYGTDIGGLSDFLRRNETTKTAEVEMKSDTSEQKLECVNDAYNNEKSDRALSYDIADINESNQLTPVEGTNIQKPVLACRRLHSTGTSNLKYNHCQRKLVFQHSSSSTKTNVDFDPHSYVESYISCENESNVKRRPRLGTLGSTKPANVVTVDELEMELVRDIKRRVERAIRCSKIKTNGSLKIKPKVQLADKSTVPSPRRHRRYGPSTSGPGVRHVQLKRESIV